MDYIEIKIKCSPQTGEMLIAELANIGFESFVENEEGIDAYVGVDAFDEEAWNDVMKRYLQLEAIAVSRQILPRINWNEEWEKNYDPILVDHEVYVRASFHPSRTDFDHEIVINPKMSFGTGHHATTYLMMKLLLERDLHGKTVLDAGSGTGILAILAHKLGAAAVDAYDIDDWCVENGNENFALNGLAGTEMKLGTIREVKLQASYDLVIANINKNVLLDEMQEYANLLRSEAELLLSGFYEHDILDITGHAANFGLTMTKQLVKSEWAAIALTKG